MQKIQYIALFISVLFHNIQAHEAYSEIVMRVEDRINRLEKCMGKYAFENRFAVPLSRLKAISSDEIDNYETSDFCYEMLQTIDGFCMVLGGAKFRSLSSMPTLDDVSNREEFLGSKIDKYCKSYIYRLSRARQRLF